MTFTHALSTNNYGPAKFIVSASVAEGTHTTIAAALTAASSGDTIFIRPGTYTENLTLKAGVSLVAYVGDSAPPHVTIVGKATFTAAGSVTISNIALQTNSDFFLAVTGSAASVVSLNGCNLQCTNNTGISFTSSSSSATINIFNCLGNLGTTGIGFYSSSSAGFISLFNCNFTNSGASTTATTASAGSVTMSYTVFSSPLSTTSTAAMAMYFSRGSTAAQNATCVTFNGSAASGALGCQFDSGTASSISIGGANVTIDRCSVTSTNTNPITGAGTIKYTPVNFLDTGKAINVTTQTPLNYGTWTPTVVGTVAGTTTYTTQQGYYTLVGNLVYVEAQIAITAATGTGTAVFGGLPFTIKNLTSYLPIGSCEIASGTWTWPVANTTMSFRGVPNTTTGNFGTSGSTVVNNLQMTNGAATFVYSMWYQI